MAEKIKFKDFSIWIKVLIIYGIFYLVTDIVAFIYGLLVGLGLI